MLLAKRMIVASVLGSLVAGSVPAGAAGYYDRDDRREVNRGYDRDYRRDRDDGRGRDEWRGRRRDWDKLGSVVADRSTDRRVVEVPRDLRYNAIMFRVDEGNVVIEDLKITFADDSVYHPDTKVFFREGERSCTIDIPPDARRVKRVRFLLKAVGRRGGDAVVDLYGLR